MEFWIKAGQLVLSLSILIVLHELGHFIPARWFKTRVEKFYLFFDPGFSLFKKKIGETEWGIGWLPLGGYVKIAGMIDESMDTKQLEKPAQPWEFRSKPAWQRLIIMIGGVTVNLILGFLIYMMVLWVWGREYVTMDAAPYGVHVQQELKQYGFQDGDIILSAEGKPVEDLRELNVGILLRGYRELEVQHSSGDKETITLPEDIDYTLFQKDAFPAFSIRSHFSVDSVLPVTPASNAGMMQGDSIISINGEPVVFFQDFTNQLRELKGEKVDLVVWRNNTAVTLTPEIDTLGKLGFSALQHIETTQIDYTFGQALASGFSYGYWTLHDYVAQLKFIFTKKGASSLGGFGAIGNMFSPTWNWQSFWLNTAFISIVLAFMNILPIPALDGGHVMFLLYEMITGREPNKKVLEYAQMIGIILLLGLLLYANGNDIFRFFFK